MHSGFDNCRNPARDCRAGSVRRTETLQRLEVRISHNVFERVFEIGGSASGSLVVVSALLPALCLLSDRRHSCARPRAETGRGGALCS